MNQETTSTSPLPESDALWGKNDQTIYLIDGRSMFAGHIMPFATFPIQRDADQRGFWIYANAY